MKFLNHLIEEAFEISSFENYTLAFIEGLNLLKKDEDVRFLFVTTAFDEPWEATCSQHGSALSGQFGQEVSRIVCIVHSQSPLTPLKKLNLPKQPLTEEQLLTFNPANIAQLEKQQERYVIHANAACIDLTANTIKTRESLYVPFGIHHFRLFRNDLPEELEGVNCHPLYDANQSFLGHQLESSKWIRASLQSIAAPNGSPAFEVVDSSVPQQLTSAAKFSNAEGNCSLWSVINALCFYKNIPAPSVMLDKVAVKEGGLLKGLDVDSIKQEMFLALEASTKIYLEQLRQLMPEKQAVIDLLRELLLEKSFTAQDFKNHADPLRINFINLGGDFEEKSGFWIFDDLQRELQEINEGIDRTARDALALR